MSTVPVRIVRAGAESIAALERLYAALHSHQARLEPAPLGMPARTAAAAWAGRRAAYERWLADPQAFLLLAVGRGGGSADGAGPAAEPLAVAPGEPPEEAGPATEPLAVAPGEPPEEAGPATEPLAVAPGAEPLGYALVTLADGFDGWEAATRIADVRDLAVLPRARGSGVGTALLDAVERELMSAGVRELRLNVLAANVDALRLYHRRGMTTWSHTLLKRLGA